MSKISASKSPKPLKNAHASNSKNGMGDYLGVGVKQKSGRMIEDTINSSKAESRKKSKPPRALA